jgi:hypothetical protein
MRLKKPQDDCRILDRRNRGSRTENDHDHDEAITTMKLHFEPNLDYQYAAIEAVCDLFRGQEVCQTEFTVTRDAPAAQRIEVDSDDGNLYLKGKLYDDVWVVWDLPALEQRESCQAIFSVLS